MVRRRRGFGCQTLDQFDDLKAFPGCQSEEGFQQPKTFDCIARWSSELLVQLRNDCGILHLAPLVGNGNGISQQT
jgi:hypothetical protein